MRLLIRSTQWLSKPFPRSKIHSNSFLIPNKKAPQNAKYSALRGCLLPAAGVEPAQSRMFIELVWNRAKIRSKTIGSGTSLTTKKEPHRTLLPQGSYREKREVMLRLSALMLFQNNVGQVPCR